MINEIEKKSYKWESTEKKSLKIKYKDFNGD